VKTTELYYETLGWKSTIKRLKVLKTKPESSLNFFDWKLDFPEVMNGKVVENMGFDIVIGNPPYVRRTALEKSDKIFFTKAYYSAYKQYDLYILFIEKGLLLLKKEGVLSFINPNKFFVSNYGEKLRESLLTKYCLDKIVNIASLNIFDNALTYPIILFIKNKYSKDTCISYISLDSISSLTHLKYKDFSIFYQNNFSINNHYSFVFETNKDVKIVVEKIKNASEPLGNFFEIKRGLPNNKIILDAEGFSSIKSTSVKKYLVKNSRTIIKIIRSVERRKKSKKIEYYR
jgi:hypothetical protein